MSRTYTEDIYFAGSFHAHVKSQPFARAKKIKGQPSEDRYRLNVWTYP